MWGSFHVNKIWGPQPIKPIKMRFSSAKKWLLMNLKILFMKYFFYQLHAYDLMWLVFLPIYMYYNYTTSPPKKL
jgi:hypothetical protein